MQKLNVFPEGGKWMNGRKKSKGDFLTEQPVSKSDNFFG